MRITSAEFIPKMGFPGLILKGMQESSLILLENSCFPCLRSWR